MARYFTGGESPAGFPGFDAATQRRLAELGMTWEYREGSDGRGSFPPQPSDRPSTKYRRLVGPWREADALAKEDR